MELLTRVRRTIARHQLAAPATRVVAAVSGGADSVALSHILAALDAAGVLRLVGLAHFNHQLRASAARDEAFSVGVALSLGQPIAVDRADVAALARVTRQSLEVAGRTARHAFFTRALADLGGDVMALGHTRDDQAETLLLRLLRGAGARGLGSMFPRHQSIVRPLLECRRAELRRFLETRQIAFVHDESNDDVSVPRNRVRHELMPLLERRFNPSVVNVLADEAEIARDEHQFFEAAADTIWSRIVRRDGRVWRLDIEGLNGLPRPVARVVLRRAMHEAGSGRPVGFAEVEHALAAGGGREAPFDAPGQRVQRIGADLVLTGREPGASGRPRRAASPAFRYPLPVPGEAVIAEAGCLVSAEILERDAPSVAASRGVGGEAAVRFDKGKGALAVRNRRPGDRFRPAGFHGRKKLQDFFVDRKVAHAQRDRVPIVVDDSDRIVWVAGYAMDEEFRVTDPSQAVIILRLKGVGGSA
jgi:tRNA(Ile)-lysidine synthase